MDLLVIGGTGFVGRHVAQAALDAGHTVSLFNRGRTNPGLFPEAEHLVGDRAADLSALEGRRWGAVVDTCGYDPAVVARSVDLLAGATEHYTFVSTIAVYDRYGAPGITEESPLAPMDPDLIARRSTGAYGPMKALCEAEVERAFPGRNLRVRCGLIVGPHDNVGRFAYWPRRVARGGDVLAPGGPERVVQLVDARDLARWVVAMAAGRRPGVFNAPGRATTLGALLDECRAVSASDARLVWVPDQFLVERGVVPQMELPLWSPLRPGRAQSSVAGDRAAAAGLACRPLAETVAAVLEWSGDAPVVVEGAEGPVGLAPERERALLDAWGVAAGEGAR